MLLRRLRLTVKSSPNRSMETGDGKGAFSPLEAYCQAFQRLLDGKTRSSRFMSHPLSLSRFHYLLPLHIRTLAHTPIHALISTFAHTYTHSDTLVFANTYRTKPVHAHQRLQNPTPRSRTPMERHTSVPTETSDPVPPLMEQEILVQTETSVTVPLPM
jgi:hypothetical protein